MQASEKPAQIRTYATAGVKDGFRRVSLIPVRAGEGRLTERIAAIRSWRRELVFMPLSSPPHRRISTTSADATTVTR